MTTEVNPNADPPQLVTAPHGRRPWVVMLAIAIVIAIGAAATSFVVSGLGWQSTNDAYLDGRVIRISPKVSGQVVALHVDDNSLVRAGDVLLEIDPADYQAKVDQAAAAVTAADSAIAQAEAQILQAEAAEGEALAHVRAAETDARQTASDYRRYAAMGTDGISAQRLETAKAAQDAADDQREASAKRLIAATAAIKVGKTAAESARSQALAARAQLRFAQLQLQYTKVIAPESGRVTKKNVEIGAFVSAGQPLLAVVPDDLWLVANFKEVQLTKMRVGQAAEIHVDAFPDLRLKAHVQSFQAGTGARFELLPPENATGNWVKVVQRVPVKITFDQGQQLSWLSQGMSAEVKVNTEGSAHDAAEGR